MSGRSRASFLAEHPNLLPLIVILVATVVAWLIGHTQDDAWITFRYSKHLAEGFGPVYNPGEYVEGYTNFLWMLLMAAGFLFGQDPVTASWVLGILFLAANLWLSWRLFRFALGDVVPAFWLLLCLATNYTLLSFGTSGLETAMNGFLVTAAFYLYFRFREAPERTRLLLWLGIVMGLLLLSRPDNLLFVLLIAGFLLRERLVRGREWWALLLPLVLLVLPWLVWKWSYYGAILPNTFHAKAGSLQIGRGMLYVGTFVLVFGLFIPPLLGLRHVGKLFLRDLTLTLTLTLWISYLIIVGGDFMAFRMWVPVLPVLYLWLGKWIYEAIPKPNIRRLAIALLLLVNAGHFALLRQQVYFGFVFPAHSAAASGAERLSFADQGKALDRLFPADDSLRFAIGTAGAFPYHAFQHHFTDLHGLTHRAETRAIGLGPGHDRMITLEGLEARKVNLLVLRCDPADQGPLPKRFSEDYTLRQVFVPQSRVTRGDSLTLLRFRIAEGFDLTCLYLRPHPVVARLVAQLGWVRYSIRLD